MSATTTPCPEPGCTGTVDADGYCDVTGMKVSTLAPAPAGATGGGTGPSTGSSTSVAATAPTTTLSPSTMRGSSTTARRTTGRPGLGLGLVEIPEVAVGDPAAAVLADPHVPEARRFCGAPGCGEPVGRAKDGKPGRTEGFCARCGSHFSFSPKLAAGDLVHGQYEVVGCLAHGGLGWVYLARDLSVEGRPVVLKGLLNTGDADAIATVDEELRFLAEVDHPSIVRVINFTRHAGDPYIVMEYVGGKTLKEVRDEHRERQELVPPSHAIAYMLEALSALGYLHQRGLVYCDFKPDNVMLTGSAIKIIDLGAVQRIGEWDGSAWGTPGYQAPEIADHGPSVASDLFTVARTLAVLCTPFRGFTSTYEYSLPTPDDEPLYAEHESLYRFLLRATDASPAARFESAEEMAEQLAGVLREIVAGEQGFTAHVASTVFTGELRRAADAGDWGALPLPFVAADDPAAGFLAAISANDVDEVLALLDLAPEHTVEVELRRVRELLEAGRVDEARDVLDAIDDAQQGAWRVAWHRGLCSLAGGDPVAATDAFAGVHHALPGELAPKLALGVAAEAALDRLAAERWYDIVSRTDDTFTSAAFGLARCRLARHDRTGAVAAYERVPRSSSASVEAQVCTAEAMLDGSEAELTVEDVLGAAGVLEQLGLRGEPRAQLAARVLHGALAVLPQVPAPNGSTPTVLGVDLDETGVRTGLERTYRELANYSAEPEERIRLVDEANRLRPKTLT